MAVFFFVAIHNGEANSLKVTRVLSDIEYASKKTGIATSTLNRIIWCESRNDQSARGINKNSLDIGIFQINSIHIPRAQKLGFDLTTRAGNISFAITLMKSNQLKDWESSKDCWK